MDAKEAKALSLEIWTYLAKHSKLKSKVELPAKLYHKIVDLRCECPLCEAVHCNACPLCPCVRRPSDMSRGIYGIWLSARSTTARRRAATEIVKRIKAWRV